jgi:hypothetical protein
MNDRTVWTLLISGLVIQAAALGVGFTSLGWRWALVGAGLLVSLGSLIAAFLDGGKPDGALLVYVGFNVLVLGLAVAHAFSTHPALVWSLRIGVGIQALGMILLALFLATFKMKMF